MHFTTTITCIIDEHTIINTSTLRHINIKHRNERYVMFSHGIVD